MRVAGKRLYNNPKEIIKLDKSVAAETDRRCWNIVEIFHRR